MPSILAAFFLLSIAGIFAQKVGDGDATHIVINEKMVDARRCIVRQMLQQIAVLVLDK